MARIKNHPEAVQTSNNLTEGNVIVWKATRPLSEVEHEQLSNKLRFEQAQSGINIMLLPYSVETVVSVIEPDNVKQEAGDNHTAPENLDPNTSNEPSEATQGRE